MLGVRETLLIPTKEFEVKWGDVQFKGMTFQERFEVGDHSARPIASSMDGTPIAFEKEYNKGKAIIFGSFAGQENDLHPVAMHPLADWLARWAALSRPKLQAPGLLELRQMYAPQGGWVFFFNHADKPASVEFSRVLEKSASNIREIATGEKIPAT
jgi:hypothetical protein